MLHRGRKMREEKGLYTYRCSAKDNKLLAILHCQVNYFSSILQIEDFNFNYSFSLSDISLNKKVVLNLPCFVWKK